MVDLGQKGELSSSPFSFSIPMKSKTSFFIFFIHYHLYLTKNLSLRDNISKKHTIS